MSYPSQRPHARLGVLAALASLAVAFGCSSAESPAHEPAVETTAVRLPVPTTPAPSKPEDATTAEIAAERRAEESVERAPTPPAVAGEADDGVLEVRFASGTAALTATARARLDALYDDLIARTTDFYLDVQGHTDRTGNEAANRRLAERRAEAVRRYLHHARGVPLDRMGVTSLGSAAPVASDRTADGRRRNRRAVVVVLLPPR